LGGRSVARLIRRAARSQTTPQPIDAGQDAGELQVRAKALYAAGWPKDVRPYQARHSMALELGERGIDLADVSAVLGHRQIATTRKHYAPVLVSRLKDASERLAGRFNGWQPDLDGSEDSAGHGSNSPSDTAATDTDGTVH
jgi:hypothetical protein